MMMAGLLSAHPELKGIAFEQPHVVAGATAALETAGVLERCRLVGGSFCETVPPGGDAYMLRRVLHDWDDGHCRVILSGWPLRRLTTHVRSGTPSP